MLSASILVYCYTIYSVQFSSVQSLSRIWLFVTPRIAARQASCPSPIPRVYSNSCPSSWWCHPAISSSVVPFSSCPQSFPASGSFPMSQLFAWGGQSTGVSLYHNNYYNYLPSLGTTLSREEVLTMYENRFCFIGYLNLLKLYLMLCV